MSSMTEPDCDTMIEIFRKMALIKICDERIRGAIKGGRMIAPHYSPRGQEAISAAMAVNLRPDDYVVTIYRGLHDHLAKGVPAKKLWAEYAGRATGSCKGKGGPMHITNPESGVVVTTGVVGSGMPIANGLAWASVLKGDGRVTVTNFGDGAANIGAFHEALNLASAWKLPVIFLCHNNRYGEHTKFELATSVAHIADRGAAYTMESVTVDGNDPIAVWRASRAAVERARSGGGPTLLEAETFRFCGHNFGDPGEYIPKQEFEDALARDPYPRYRAWLISTGVASEELLGAIESEVTREVTEAEQFALTSPYPELSELLHDVYAHEIRP